MQKLKIAFWGTPELTKTYLDALAKRGMLPVVIVTNPDRPKGRGHELAPTPAKVWALAHGVPVLQSEKRDDAFFEEFKKYGADISIVVAYGSLLPERFITLPKYKTLNVHYSLLPHLRGASPIESAILLAIISSNTTSLFIFSKKSLVGSRQINTKSTSFSRFRALSSGRLFCLAILDVESLQLLLET